MTSFLPEQTETLRQLSQLWRDTPFVPIGANALALQIDLDRHSVQVATTPTIVVMRMVAFLDRPDREDDLTDIAQVLERHLGPVDDRRWILPVDFDNASAFALGMDIAVLVNDRERQIVTEFLRKAKDENDRHLTHALLIRNGPRHWREHPEVLFDRLAAFENGMLSRRAHDEPLRLRIPRRPARRGSSE